MRYFLVITVFSAFFTFGCNKNHDETRSSANSLTEPSPSASAFSSSVADFSSQESTSWVNGTPISLAEARGKNVVLIEAWHPA